MAKSKSGGTRSYIRGKVGSDVFSIGRNAAGNRQQIVRSLAEEVANPQTINQMKGRCIMYTVMQAMSGLTPIVNHSFDGFVAGQPCLSKFIKENYALVKADIEANPISGNSFGINEYQERGIKQGKWLISQGSADELENVAVSATAKTLTIAVGTTLTPANVRSALGITLNDYFTLVSISADGKCYYERARVYATIDNDETITDDNIDGVFTMDGNNPFTASVDGTNIVLTFANMTANFGIIVSRKASDGYSHSKCEMVIGSDPEHNYTAAFATYPIGANRFLNGGSEAQALASEVSGDSGSTSYSGQLTALTYGGSNVLSSSISVTAAAGSTVAGTVSALPESGTLALYIGSTNVGTITNTSFSFDVASADTVGVITLRLDGTTIQTCGTVSAAASGTFSGQLTELTADGTSVLSASDDVSVNSSYTIAGKMSALPSSGTLELKIGSTVIATITETEFSQSGVTAQGQIKLYYNSSVIQTCGSTMGKD